MGVVLRWSARLAVWALAAAVAVTLVVMVVLPRLTHGFAMTVLTGSMSPGIPVGSAVLVRPVDPETLAVGDVATYAPADAPEGTHVTHRITSIDRAGGDRVFTFKGDANEVEDSAPVPAEQVVGEVWFHVPYLGAARDALHGKAGLSLLAMVVLGGYTLAQLGGAFGDSRRKKQGSTAASVELPGTVVLATLPLAHRDGWDGLVVEATDETVRLILAPPPDGTAAMVELLRQQGASDVTVLDGPVTLAGSLTDQLTPAPRETQHA
jgi:signal peptidase